MNGRRTIKKMKAIEYLGGKCILCGYSRCPEALHFHHKKKGKKNFSISGAYMKPWSEIQRELDKCILVCANCHAEVHHRHVAKLVRRTPDKGEIAGSNPAVATS